MDPLVSVVIQAHDRTPALARSVGGVLGQAYPADRLEIIVVDGGSKDRAATEAALAPFGDRVRLLKAPKGGASSARNQGIRRAAGELIALLDADDLWRPEKTRKQVDFLAAHPDYGMVLCDLEVVDPDGTSRGMAPRRAQFPRDGMILDHVLLHPRLDPSSVMIRKSVIDQMGLFDETLRTAEDVDFILRVARSAPIGVIEEPLALHTAAVGESAAASADKTSSADYMHVMQGFVTRYAAEIDPRVAHRALLRAGLRNATGLIASGRGREGARLYAEAVLHARDSQDLAEVARQSARIGALLGRGALASAKRAVRP